MQSPLYIPVTAPDWCIGVSSLFALLADPEDDAAEKRLRTLDALGSLFGKTWARQSGRERVDPEFSKRQLNKCTIGSIDPGGGLEID